MGGFAIQRLPAFADSKISKFKDRRQGRNSAQLRWIPDSMIQAFKDSKIGGKAAIQRFEDSTI
jgi:hypothetical protein